MEINADAAASAIEIIQDVGVRRRIVDSRTVELAEPGLDWSRWALAIRRRSPSPSQIENDLHSRTNTGILYVVPSASSYLQELVMTDAPVAFVDLTSRSVGFRGVIWAKSPRQVRKELPPINRRRPWARMAVMRLLTLARNPMTQTQLAQGCGVSQAAVSQSLASMGERVRKTAAGWEAQDRELIWREFMHQYRGPGGLASYWSSIASPEDQLRRCAQVASSESLVSGDWAADEYAPWRRPTVIVIYSGSQADLSSVLFGESDESHSTIEWRVPGDPTLLYTAKWYREYTESSSPAVVRGTHLALVDPMVAAWDVDRGTSTDVIDAVEALRTFALGRS